MRPLITVFCVAITGWGCGGSESDPEPVDAAADILVIDDAEGDMALDVAILDVGVTPDVQPLDMQVGPMSIPTIIGGEAFLNTFEGGFGLKLEGTDLENDVMGIGLELLDADGQAFQLNENGGPIEVRFSLLRQGLGNWIGFFSSDFSVDSPLIGIASARVTVFDEAENRSESIELAVVPTPIIAEGEECDYERGISRCVEGTLCGAVAGGRRQCQPAVTECPRFYGAIDLDEQENWSYQGDTREQPILGESDCGGGVGNQVFEFTAPEAGLYHFETFGQIDSVLWTRSHCQFRDSAVQRACNDDVAGAAGILTSRLNIEMQVDEAIYVFVDGFNSTDPMVPSWSGPYRLEASKVYAPTLAGSVWFNQTVGRWSLGLSLTGQDQDRDVGGVVYQLFDQDGDLLENRDGSPRGRLVTPEWDGDHYQIELGTIVSGPFPQGTIGVSRVNVAVIDAAGNLSNVLSVVPERPPVQAVGARCDLVGALNRCGDEMVCSAPDDELGMIRMPEPADAGVPDGGVPDGGEGADAGVAVDAGNADMAPAPVDPIEPVEPEWPGVCEAPVAACRQIAGWETQPVMGGDGIWSGAGDTTGNTPFLTRSGCGGGGGIAIWTFDPPANGNYTVTITTMDQDARLIGYVRSHCRYDEARFALGCSNNIIRRQGNRQVKVTFPARAGQQAFIFVDGANDPAMPNPWTGAYTLEVIVAE